MKYYTLIFLVLYLVGCQNSNIYTLDNTVNIVDVNNYNQSVIKYGEAPVLILGGKLVSNSSLKKIYQDLKADYAHIECNLVNEMKPKGSIDIKNEFSNNKEFILEFDLEFCAENDPNHRSCVSNINELKEKLTSDLSCKIIFGGMTKPKTIVSNSYTMKRVDMVAASKFIP